jgi:hypothetical protein
VVGGQWSVVSGRWSVVGGQWSVVDMAAKGIRQPAIGGNY